MIGGLEFAWDPGKQRPWDVSFGGVPEELDLERAHKARGSVGAKFRMYRSPVASRTSVQGARWIRGVTEERTWEVEGSRVGLGRGRPYGSQ